MLLTRERFQYNSNFSCLARTSFAFVSRSVTTGVEPADMKTIVIVGLVIFVLGVLALAYQGFDYTTKEKVVDLGPIEATAEREKSVSVPPLVGVVLAVSGIVLVVVGVTRRA
jgi:hypothetical protein